MNSVSFYALARQFELLPEQAKKEAYDFVEFLIHKRNIKKNVIDKKKILLGMSCWDDDAIKRVTDVRAHMNKWEPKTF